jgi:hypothetical protein
LKNLLESSHSGNSEGNENILFNYFLRMLNVFKQHIIVAFVIEYFIIRSYVLVSYCSIRNARLNVQNDKFKK